MKLLDTDVLIDLFHRNPLALLFIDRQDEAHEELAISAITLVELLGGMRPGEEERTARLLHQFAVIEIDEAIARQAARFLRTYTRSHRIQTSDALIAATAFLRGADLVTRNVRHYPMPEVLVIEPYRRGTGD